MMTFLLLFMLISTIVGKPTIYDGRAPFTLKNDSLDTSLGPYLTVVKGSQKASYYTKLLDHRIAPTPLWNPYITMEQVISVTIDNTSIFSPGSNLPQTGFRRTELIAQKNGSNRALDAEMEVEVTAFHFSIKMDEQKPLNYDHEYQIVFIERSDGTHVFGIQLGSPFTIPKGPLPADAAHSFKVLDHALNVLFTTSFSPGVWHNFAIQIDWDQRALSVFYSKDKDQLRAVTGKVPNTTTASGSAGQGDFHFGILKLPLANVQDSLANQQDVVHYGTQEGTTECLLFSGIFVEKAIDGVSMCTH